MSLFELVFGLGAIILGLALTHMATNLHRLILAGRRVTWALEPLLLATLIGLVIVSVWLGQWIDRRETSTTVGLVLMQVLKLLLPYMAAAFVFPEGTAESGDIDMFRHYDRTRAYTFGALIVGLLLFWADGVIEQVVTGGRGLTWSQALHRGPWLYVTVYVALIFVRARWFNVLALSGVVLWFGWNIVPVTLSQ